MEKTTTLLARRVLDLEPVGSVVRLSFALSMMDQDESIARRSGMVIPVRCSSNIGRWPTSFFGRRIWVRVSLVIFDAGDLLMCAILAVLLSVNLKFLFLFGM